MGNNRKYGSDDRASLYAMAAKDRGLFYNGMQLPYDPALTAYAKLLRKAMTECELRVFGFLKKLNTKVRAQHPIDHYIVDFFLPEYDLVIEIDGEQHVSVEGKEYDHLRDSVLRGYGLLVIRVLNDDVRTNFLRVCHQIRASMAK